MSDNLTPQVFYPIPEYENYSISPDGEICNIYTGKYMKPYVDTRGYVHVCLRNKNGTKTMSLHRLLLTVFKPCENMRHLTVDHINGDPSDNRLDNLEWCTAQENIRRAAAKGLYGRKRPVETFNPKTGEIIPYPTRAACAAAHNLSKGSMFTRLASNGSRVYPEGLQYRYISETPWPVCNITDSQQNHYGMHQAITLKNLCTNEIIHFSTIKDAMSFLNKSQSYFSTRYALNTQPLLHGWWLARLDTDPSPWRMCDPITEWLQQSEFSLIVEVYDSLFLYRFTSLKEAADYFNIKITTAHYRASTNGTTIFTDNTRWGYYPFLSDNYSTFM